MKQEMLTLDDYEAMRKDKCLVEITRPGERILPYCDLKEQGCWDTSVNRRCFHYIEYVTKLMEDKK